MKFAIFKTNTLLAAKNRIEELLSCVDPADILSPHILLVPDRASLAAERSLLKRVGGSFNIQVFTFSRYANVIAPQSLKPLTKQMAVLEIMKLLERYSERLICFSNSGNTEGFAEKLYNVVSLLKYNRIKPERLLSAVTDKAVELKIKDIALVYEAYQAAIANRYLDSADKLECLIEALSGSAEVKRSTYYIYDFDNLSVQEEAIVENLARFSRGVNAACVKGRGFMYSDDFYSSLNRIANRIGVCEEFQSHERVGKYFDERERSLMTGVAGQPTICTAEDFVLTCAADADAEAYNLAAFVDSHVRKGGRYGDIKVIVSDVEEYADPIARYFALFGIPCFLDVKLGLDRHALCRFLLAFFRMKRANMKLDAVLPFVKSYFFGGDENDIFLFENFCLKYNFGYDFSSFDLGGGESEEIRAAAERVRIKLCEFTRIDVPPRGTVAGYVDLARRLVKEHRLFERLSDLAEGQGYVPDYYAKFSEQVPVKLPEVFDELEQTAGSLIVDVERFVGFLSAAMSNAGVSILPLYCDCVEVSNLDKGMRHDVRVLALLGANEGKLPVSKSDSCLLTDDNLRRLVGSGISLSPDVARLNKNERFGLSMLLLESQDKLYVSFRNTDADGSGLKPSSFVRALQMAHVRPDGSRPEPETNPDFGLHGREWAAFELLRARSLGKTDYAARLESALGDDLLKYKYEYSPDIVLENGRSLFFRSGASSVTRIEEFYKCPFRHFLAKGGLELRERDIARLKPADLGSIVHDCLEKFVRLIMECGLEVADEDAMRRIFDKVIDDDKYRAVQRDRLSRHNLHRLREETVKIGGEIVSQLRASKFFPVDCEARFGPHAKYPSASIETRGGGKIEFRGAIDRIDRFRDKFVIIDYKRGRSVFRDKDLYAGVKLQLPVYLKVVRDALGITPVGFYYKKLNNDFTRDDFREFGGRTVCDLETLNELDTEFFETGRSVRLNVKRNKNGTLSQQTKSVLTKAQLNAYVDYAWEMLARAGEEMSVGNACQSPYEGACDFCEFLRLCDFGDLSGRRERSVAEVVTPDVIENAVSVEKNR